MKEIIGTLIIVLGVCLGLYLGIYVMFYGGICQVINGINPLEGKDIALGVLRILFCKIGFKIPMYLGAKIGSYLMYK